MHTKHNIFDNGRILSTAHKRPMTKKRGHEWWKYVYDEYSDLYKLRKEKIERVFADAKEMHTMRYTPYTGLARVTNWVRLKFATMNFKKLAK